MSQLDMVVHLFHSSELLNLVANQNSSIIQKHNEFRRGENYAKINGNQ